MESRSVVELDQGFPDPQKAKGCLKWSLLQMGKSEVGSHTGEHLRPNTLSGVHK